MVKASPAAFAPRGVVFAIFLRRGQAFGVILQDRFFVSDTVFGEGRPYGVVIRLCGVTVPPAAVVRVVVSVVVMCGLVSQLHSVRCFVGRQLARWVFVESFEAVTGHCTGATGLSFVGIVHSGRSVVFPVLSSCQEDPRHFLDPFCNDDIRG